jgi:hypothetical protein
MNFLENVEIIKAKFTIEGYKEISNEIEDLQIALGTSGEVFASLVFYFNNIKNNKATLYLTAKIEIDEIIKYGKSIDYI